MKAGKRMAAALLAAALLTVSASAEEITLTTPWAYMDNDINAAYYPWGAKTADGEERPICYAYCNGENNGFTLAYTVCESPFLTVGKAARFTTVTEGGVAPFVYVYDVYYQQFSNTNREYIGELHEISTNPHLDFTPRREGRYLITVSIEDAAGNSVNYDVDAIPTDRGGKLSETVETVSSAALAECGEYETVCYLVNWIKDKAEYDHNGGYYESDCILVDGKGVCSGYAGALSILCSACGIECISVHGYATAQPIKGKEHAWNAVKIGGDWYHIDVTWLDRDNYDTAESSPLMTSVMASRSHCFGTEAGAAASGGACLPPWCNATMYAEGYEGDPIAESVEITVKGQEGGGTISLNVGDVVTLTGTTTPRCSRHGAKLWTVSNELATITANGVLSANASGVCHITLNCGNLTATRKVVIK